MPCPCCSSSVPRLVRLPMMNVDPGLPTSLPAPSNWLSRKSDLPSYCRACAQRSSLQTNTVLAGLVRCCARGRYSSLLLRRKNVVNSTPSMSPLIACAWMSSTSQLPPVILVFSACFSNAVISLCPRAHSRCYLHFLT